MADVTSLIGGPRHLHLRFQSSGGHPGSGIYVYDLFRRFPFPITVYNVGQVSSIGVVAYLGAQLRIPPKVNVDSEGNANGIPGRRRTVIGA